MQSSSWATLLARLPIDQHARLMMVTSAGTELAIQRILFLQGDCLIVKGRLSGSQDTGRVFFIPFSHVDYLGFQTSVLESDIREWFGEDEILARLERGEEAPLDGEAVLAEAPPSETEPTEPPAPEVTAEEPPATDVPPPAAEPSQPASGVRPSLSPARSALLDRVKSRSIIGNRNSAS